MMEPVRKSVTVKASGREGLSRIHRGDGFLVAAHASHWHVADDQGCSGASRGRALL